MPQYLYQLAYTPESLAAQIKNPQDRLELVGKQLVDAVGAHIVGGGYSFGELTASKNGAGRIRAGRATHHPSETFLPEQVERSAKVRTEQIRKTAVVMLYPWPSDVAESRPSR